jgi:hypothetical protein
VSAGAVLAPRLARVHEPQIARDGVHQRGEVSATARATQALVDRAGEALGDGQTDEALR